MALVNPILFSKRFSISQSDFQKSGLIEPILNCDTNLFIDPTLIPNCNNTKFSKKSILLINAHISDIITLLETSSSNADALWKAAVQQINLNEFPYTGLGFGGSGTSGASREKAISQSIAHNFQDIIKLGYQNPNLIHLVGLFDEGVGPDTISDFISNIISEPLCEVSEAFFKKHNLPTKVFPKFFNKNLVENPTRPGSPIILVPADIVRELPIATDWSDLPSVLSQVHNIKTNFNSYISSISKATMAQRKAALKRSIKTKSDVKDLIAALLSEAYSYDKNSDVLNYYAVRKIVSQEIRTSPPTFSLPATRDLPTLKAAVDEIIEHFKDLIENKNLWELLWDGKKAKRERAAQLLFYGVADVFCKINNIDITPEANMGGGPVDFKFSSGYKERVVVEMKKSNGAVKNGYDRQLEIYKKAASTEEGIFIIIDIGSLGKKLSTIEQIQAQKRSHGEKASDIVHINGKRRASASKTKN